MIDRQPEPTAAHERAQERMVAALVLLDAGIGAIVDGASFRAYLATLARFPTYSARNVALIGLIQTLVTPDAVEKRRNNDGGSILAPAAMVEMVRVGA